MENVFSLSSLRAAFDRGLQIGQPGRVALARDESARSRNSSRSSSRSSAKRVARHVRNSFEQERSRSGSRNRTPTRGECKDTCRHRVRSSSRGRGRHRNRGCGSDDEKQAPPRPTVAQFVEHPDQHNRAASRSKSRTREQSGTEERASLVYLPMPHRNHTRPTDHDSSSSSMPWMGPGLANNLARSSYEVCKEFRRTGRCGAGDHCIFAHPQAPIIVNTASDRSQNKGLQSLSKKQQAAERRKRYELDQSRTLAESGSMERARRFLEQQLSADGGDTLLHHTVAVPHVESAAGDGAEDNQIQGRQDLADEAHNCAGGATAGTAIAEPMVGDCLPCFNPVEENPRLSMFDNENWTVLLADHAFGGLQKANKTDREHIVETLKKLASGNWSPEHCEVVGTHEFTKLRLAKCGNVCVLWGIDMDFSQQINAYSEVLQIWDIVEDRDLEASTRKAMEELQASRVSKRSRQAIFKALPKLPKLGGTRLPRIVDKNKLQDGDVFSVRKFFTLDAGMLRTILRENATKQTAISASEQFPLRISAREAALIEKKGPVIAIGRSGSGKTLCCVYRMFFQYQSYWKDSVDAGGQPIIRNKRQGGFSHFNQVFVTHSASLANKVLEYFSNLQETSRQSEATGTNALFSGGLPTAALLEQSCLPDTLGAVRCYPLFLTFRKLLVMLDGTLPAKFFPRRPNGAVNTDRIDLAVSPDALDPISALREQKRAVERSMAGASQEIKREVDYDLFIKKLWPKMAPKCPPHCDPALVWREIQSHIKGSYKVLDTTTGFLSLEDYRETAKNISPAFEDYRNQMYDAFLTYAKLLVDYNYFDRMDACFHIVKHFKQHQYSGPPIHSAAVDEVQDLSQLELSLFLFVLEPPYEELFICGDTSQTVSKAVDFRFCDLRSLFHDFGVKPPEIDQLLVNYRSHQKILELSHHGVVRPLEIAFPHSVDTLQADLGHRDGPMPIVVNDVTLNDLCKELFSLDGRPAGIAFGASQCVIVRNEASKKSLPPELQKALVLTIEQSKGLEFDDVIVVNFFTDSGYKDWQVMKTFLQDANDMNLVSGEHRKRPQFDNHRHALLCSELKHLYVGATRTRHVLLFVEQDTKQAMHAFDFWSHRGLVNVGLLRDESQDAIVNMVARSSESGGEEQWKAAGHNLLSKHLFEQAKAAFGYANDESMVCKCDAYITATHATKMMEESLTESHQLYLQAAELFRKAGALRESAVCLVNGGKYMDAARIFEELGPELRKEAADAFRLAGEYRKSSNIFLEIGEHREALECLVRADVPSEVKRVVLDAHRSGILKADECFVYLQHMESHDVAGELYMGDGDFARAADCFHSAELFGKEAECYERMGEHRKAADIMTNSSVLQYQIRAAELYTQLRDTHATAKCLKRLLSMHGRDMPDSEKLQFLERCATMYENLQFWADAADHWEKRGDEVGLTKARRCYAKALQTADEARICEKQGDLHLAGNLYEKVADWSSAVRIWEALGDSQNCGRIFKQLGDFNAAASHYGQAGCTREQAECLASMKKYSESLRLLETLPLEDRDHQSTEIEVQCLYGLNRYNEGAVKQMYLLQVSGHVREERDKLVLQAFEMARRDRNTFRAFRQEFADDAPDPVQNIVYFAENGNAEDLAEELQSVPKRVVELAPEDVVESLRFAEAALASLTGNPMKAIKHLEDMDDRDEPMLPLMIVDVIFCYIDAFGDEGIVSSTAKSLLEVCDNLWQRFRGEECTRVELLKLLLHGKEKGKHGIHMKDAKQVLKALGELGEDNALKQQRLLIEEQQGLLENNRDHKLVSMAITQLCSVCQKLTDEQITGDYALNAYYCICPELHQHLFRVLNHFRLCAGKPALSGSASKLAPSVHRLVHGFQSCSGLYWATPILDARSAIVKDLSLRQEKLLERLSTFEHGTVATTTPTLWENARKQAPDECRSRFEIGFVKAMRAACDAVITSSATLAQPLKNHIPACAKKLCDNAYEEAYQALRETDSDFQSDKLPLFVKLQSIVRMFQVLHPRKNDATLQCVLDLTLGEVTKLKPICHDYFERKACDIVDKGDACPCEHPHIWKTIPAKLLLQPRPENSKRYLQLFGVGFQAYLDVINICERQVNNTCRAGETCNWWHPPESILKILKKATPQIDRKWETTAKVVAALAPHFHARGARKIPEGFGFVFKEDKDLMMNVRLVALVAKALLTTRIDFQTCRPLLLRMCLSAYRYPDIEGCKIVKQVLNFLKPEELKDLSGEVEWWVLFGQDQCYLLGELLGKTQKRSALKPSSILQRPQTTSVQSAQQTWYPNPNAPAFKPQQQPQENRWQQGDSRSLFSTGWAPTLAGSSSGHAAAIDFQKRVWQARAHPAGSAPSSR